MNTSPLAQKNGNNLINESPENTNQSVDNDDDVSLEYEDNESKSDTDFDELDDYIYTDNDSNDSNDEHDDEDEIVSEIE
jgi:hypothetical protein